MDRNKQLDKIRGSLVGGAVGDAFGYPVEFISSYEGIQKRYGENGITRLDTTSGGCRMKKRAARHGFLTTLR